MAKKEITAASSHVERRIANEQLAKVEQEFSETLQQFKNDQGVLVRPNTNIPLTSRDIDAIAVNISKKYDYVDYGFDYGSNQTEINVSGRGNFFVKGLNEQQTSYAPEAKTTVNQDDAFPAVRTDRPPVSSNANPQDVNPKAAKTDQNTAIESAPQLATDLTQIQTQSPDNTSSVGSKDATQAGEALERNNKNNPQNQNGIVNENQNELPTTNNLPGRLSDEYLKEPAISDGIKNGNSDDAGSRNVPFGTAFNGFINPDAITVSPDAGTTGTGGVSIGTSQGISVPNQAAGTPNNPNVQQRPNILHNYANWTYKIGLYLLSINDYNLIITNGEVVASATQHIVAKTGGYARTQAAGNLPRDVYIDNLRFTSVIGNRLSGTATNNIDLSMTITEPYSASFMVELAALASFVNGENITLAENPYLLEIDFAGYNDDGSIVESILKNGKKYIPVKIIAIEMKVDSAGAKYTIQMVPYGFYQYTQKRASLPKGEYVYGATLEEVAGARGSGLINKLNLIELEKAQKDRTQDWPDRYFIKFYSFNKAGSSTDELANSKVAFPLKDGPEATIIINRGMKKNEPTKQGYNIASGTLIKDAIKTLVMASEYFNTRMRPEAEDSNGNPAELIKIIPQIKLTNLWDSKRNEYAKEITFHVFNTLLFGENFKNGGLAPIGDWGYTKIYDWIFTGKNQDIIDLNIDFNLLYYTKFFTDKEELGAIITGMVANRTGTPGSATTTQISETNINPAKIGSSAPNQPSRYINASLAAEFMDLKMNNSYADNIVVDMDIIGDPDWIPQDASVLGGSIKVADFNTKLVNNSIGIDVAGVYAKLRFRTPRDYDDTTGLMALRNDSLYVGGVYQVITVENIFEGGKFTSRLNMVKIPNQEENVKPNSSTSGTNVAREVNAGAGINNPAVNLTNPNNTIE